MVMDLERIVKTVPQFVGGGNSVILISKFWIFCTMLFNLGSVKHVYPQNSVGLQRWAVHRISYGGGSGHLSKIDLSKNV